MLQSFLPYKQFVIMPNIYMHVLKDIKIIILKLQFNSLFNQFGEICTIQKLLPQDKSFI